VTPGTISSSPSWNATRPAKTLRTIATTSSGSNGARSAAWHMQRPVA
jgi:hypothetical protein